MRRPALLRQLSAPAAALAALTMASSPALAQGLTLRADLVEAKAIKLDGVPKEWPSGLVGLGQAARGKPAKPDLEARGAVAYDAASIYVAVDVTDDKLRSGADHALLILAFPGGATHEIALYPGDPGKTAGSAKVAGKAVSGARVVEAPRAGGYTLEASIPWATFAEAKTVRVGLRGALFVHDADDGAVDAVVGTWASAAHGSLPAMATEPEQALADGLLREKNLRGAPRCALLADVAGDATKERVLVFERYLVILGSAYRGGSEYYFSDLGVDASAGMLPGCEARDVTGDGQAELVFRKRVGTAARFREMLQIMTCGSSDVPRSIFRHETGLTTEAGSITNDVSFVSDGGKPAVKIDAGAARGFHAGNYREATETAFDALLLPWGTVKSRTFKWSASTFTKVAEEKQQATAAPPQAQGSTSAPPPAAKPPAPSASELLDQVYDLYKRERGARGKARFDFAVDVAGSKQVERVLLHDRDLVVFGKGYKGGTGYASLTLSNLAASSDILELTARDLTGDGKAEIIVRGLIHASAPKEAGGGPVDREVVMVFQASEAGLKRVFAAEIGRSMGKKRVQGAITFGAKEIELAAGKATEWTEKTYPFNEDTGPVGGFEPLLLPWGSVKSARYRWSGAGFSR